MQGGWGTVAPGKEARLDFCSLTIPRGRPSRPAMSAGPLALCLAWPRRRGGPGQGPLPTFRHFREKQMTASVSRMLSSFSTALTPLACPERPPQPEGTPGGTPSRLVASVDACDSPSAVLVLTSHFPKRKEINIQIHLSSKWSFAAKKESSSSRGPGGNAALRYAER